MLFNSLEFGLFFGLILVGLALLPRGRAVNIFLLVASYVFYAGWDPRFLVLLWISTVVDYFVGLQIDASTDPRVRKRWLSLSLATNLGILGFFKYLGFFSASLQALLEPAGIRLAPWALEVVLPVGISFYTFQTLSYTIDVYRGDLKPTRSLVDFGLYVAFFPQLVAGPIERATHFLPQIQKSRRANLDEVSSGTWLVLWGLFKKVVIADNLAPLVDSVFDPGVPASGAEVLFGTYAFAFQIYCDFSGYTDIARGAARMMGFDLMLNFDLPYRASSMSDFWRRWHISLSTWLRDYLYIPLGGNRNGKTRTFYNLMITMLLGGLWHGAGWTFVSWGIFHGLLLVAERVSAPIWETVGSIGGNMARVGKVLATCLTFNLVCLGWLVFRSEDLSHATALLSQLAGPFQWETVIGWFPGFFVLLGPLLLLEAFQARTDDHEVVLRWPLVARTLLYLSLLLAILLIAEDGGSPFIYFRF